MEKYEKLEKVGEGTYGKVYKAKDKTTGQLMLSNSHYIGRLLCVEHVDKKRKPLLYLVFEYIDTDLKKYIDSHRKAPNPRSLPPTLIRSILYQLFKGVAH
nr:cell division control protein 2 homolog C [Ipomoea batatas]